MSSKRIASNLTHEHFSLPFVVTMWLKQLINVVWNYQTFIHSRIVKGYQSTARSDDIGKYLMGVKVCLSSHIDDGEEITQFA